MITEIDSFTDSVEISKTIGDEILNKFIGYTTGFSKATLTLCLATLIKKESEENRLIDITTINILLNKICKIPTIH
jgi:hypothetical protein